MAIHFFFFVATLFLFQTVRAKPIETTQFQTIVLECFPEEKKLPTFRQTSEIYKYFDNKYTLLRSQLVEKEVSYREANEERKLKYLNGKISLYKVNKEKDDQVEPIPNDVRQRSLTVESYIKQLLLRAHIESDWSTRTEQRMGGVDIDITEKDRRIFKLLIKNNDNQKTIECQVLSGKDVCKCQK